MFINRRQFLRNSAQYGSLVGLRAWAPDLLVRARPPRKRPGATSGSWSSSSSRAETTGSTRSFRTGRRLLPGASQAWGSRPRKVLKIGNDLGFHPLSSLSPGCWRPGRSRSFRGWVIPIRTAHTSSRWTSGTPASGRPTAGPRGWLGKYLEATHGDDTSAMHIGGGKQPFALTADRVRVPRSSRSTSSGST